MGYAFATAACFGCGRDFCFNPRRVARGLDPIRVLPGAYEPIREEEL